MDSTSYIPRRLLKKIGYKLAKDEESGEWEAVEREGADQVGPCWGAVLDAAAVVLLRVCWGHGQQQRPVRPAGSVCPVGIVLPLLDVLHLKAADTAGGSC